MTTCSGLRTGCATAPVEAVAISQNCFPYNEGSNSIDLGIDSVAVNVRLLWVEADFFRVFRYAFTEEAEFAKGRGCIPQ